MISIVVSAVQSWPCLSFPSTWHFSVSTVPAEARALIEANGPLVLPEDPEEDLSAALQLLQAEAIRYGVEHLRRNRGRCMGAVYWQLNDCWPVASWSSIDYFGRWKALHYYARRFFAPVMISCEEEGLLTQSMNTNAEPFEVRKSIRLNSQIIMKDR